MMRQSTLAVRDGSIDILWNGKRVVMRPPDVAVSDQPLNALELHHGSSEGINKSARSDSVPDNGHHLILHRGKAMRHLSVSHDHDMVPFARKGQIYHLIVHKACVVRTIPTGQDPNMTPFARKKPQGSDSRVREARDPKHAAAIESIKATSWEGRMALHDQYAQKYFHRSGESDRVTVERETLEASEQVKPWLRRNSKSHTGRADSPGSENELYLVKQSEWAALTT